MIQPHQADETYKLVMQRIGDVASLPDWELLEKQVLKWEEEIAELKEAVKARNAEESAAELTDCMTVGVMLTTVLKSQIDFNLGASMVLKARANVSRFNKPL